MKTTLTLLSACIIILFSGCDSKNATQSIKDGEKTPAAENKKSSHSLLNGYSAFIKETDTPHWAAIVTEFVDSSSANRAAQLMSIGKQMGWYGDADFQSVNIKAIQSKPIMINTILEKYGKPDTLITLIMVDPDSKDKANKYYNIFKYDSIISLCVPKNGEIVDWIDAPVGYWVEGIRKKAEDALHQKSIR